MRGQRATYLGLEIGPKFEVYRYTDNGNYLYTKPFFDTPVFGITIGQKINKTFLAETGLYFVDYGESYRLRKSDFYFTTNAIFVYQIPFRLKARLNLIEDRLNLTGTVGYSLNINSEFTSMGFTIFSYYDGQDSIFSVDTSDYGLRKTYPLLETGLALEYQFKNRMVLYFAGHYFFGLTRVINIDVYYKTNNEPYKYANVYSKGDYYSFVLGVKFPIGKLSTKERKK